MTETATKLNDLLRGEIAAVETYRQALGVAKDANINQVLQQCQADHSRRASRLTELVQETGGKPVEESGAWGAFAKLVEGGAAILGEEAALGSLEEGEDQGLQTYKDEIKHLDASARAVVEQELLPGQVKTYEAITMLKKNFSQLTK
jgi:uncharacterized protein (TIGR02284 family)